MSRTASQRPEPLSLDHVGLVGDDLADMREAFTRLGFAPTEPRDLLGLDPASGRVVPLSQQSCHLVFERGYVELSSLGPYGPSHHLARYAGRYDGLHILALGSRDVDAVFERLRDAGVVALEPSFAARDVSYGKAGTARFRWFMLGPDIAPEALVCVVQQLTPEVVFQPEVQQHPNTAIALVGTTLVVPNPKSTASLLAALAGLGAIDDAGDTELSLPGGTLSVVSAATYRRHFPRATLPTLPCLAALKVRVRDLAAVAEHCARAGVPVEPSSLGFWVHPRYAAGALVEWVG